jgi:Rieske Fe-S protein
VLLGAGAVGTAGLLAACGGGSDQPAAPGGGETTPAAPPTTDDADGADGVPTSAAAVQRESVPMSDIPVGGGKIYPDKTLVVTQPTQGQFKAFDATCTHQQCLVSSIDAGLITCPCHGSQFHIDNGAVSRGPAPRSLNAKNASVSGDQVIIS